MATLAQDEKTSMEKAIGMKVIFQKYCKNFFIVV